MGFTYQVDSDMEINPSRANEAWFLSSLSCLSIGVRMHYLDLTKSIKKLDGNYTRMLRAILNISRKQHPTKQQLYGSLPPISQTIKEKRARFSSHCCRSKAEIISDVLLWAPKHCHNCQGGQSKNYINQLCEDADCHRDDLPEMMIDRAMWREHVMRIRATSTPR